MTNLAHLATSFRKSKHKLKDSINYVYSQYRYQLYYSPIFCHLMRPHIREQIDFRVQVMNKECYNRGSCHHCGCTTIALQMSGRMCEGREYPPMMHKEHWELFSQGHCRLTHEATRTTWRMIVTKHTTILIVYQKNEDGTIHTHEVQLNTPLHKSIQAKH